MDKKLFGIVLITFLVANLFGYSDADLDGVDDAIDKCPNTPLIDLVDISGCTIQKIAIDTASYSHFDIILGVDYTGSNYVVSPAADTYSTSIQIDYYYKNFSIQAYTSYYSSTGESYDDRGFNDSSISVAYSLNPLPNFTFRISSGAILPTYTTEFNNNHTDYFASANLSYLLSKINLYAGYVYTKINDDDIIVTTANPADSYSILYQNTNAVNAGVGYYFNNALYISGGYNQTQSIYQDVEDAKSISLYVYYTLTKNWFANLSYAYGLSDPASDHAASIKIGYYF